MDFLINSNNTRQFLIIEKTQVFLAILNNKRSFFVILHFVHDPSLDF